ncbi:hypothetical protein [Clostridium botulinum]|uniref:hypothetical protein n=1 Tax=Clostridium botulinum TaxID=1491 RepID=UPI0004D39BA5|nr:hypothetical protein [Clostridium botulinum]KEI05442.1 hypothetical protein Z952_05205 [Clostridium botulinum C/D str. BKT75002]KEI09393.1 hypothetical protein Z954_12735 [Clostridium botulinum C/D str. BKT2873]MCD3349413.1 hypothetical protein [Clostridium botulinum D/C]MCD3358596.1 hypothetical protein [Clostridium botulinum D/C]MCD3363669.1 hypothetical protein [Clostridium botulinum D/C]
MNGNYVTLFNGLTLLIKPTHRIGQFLYCYHWFNNSWVPLELNMNIISDMRYVKFAEPTNPYNTSINNFFNDTVTNTFTSIPNTLDSYLASGKKIFTNISTHTDKTRSDTVICPVFPEIESEWFYKGFPSKLKVGGTNSNLIKYIPIHFYATKNGNETFTLPKLPDRLGYLDSNNHFSQTFVWKGPFKKGNLLFTVLLNKNDSACKGCRLNNSSYWNLITEFDDAGAESKDKKSLTLTSGIKENECYSMALSIGSHISTNSNKNNRYKIYNKLSSELSESFNSNVSILEEITTNSSIEFKPQSKPQRIAAYQFVESFKIDIDDLLQEKIKFFNNSDINFVANFTKAKFEEKVFDYNTHYFAKAFVLDLR